jgi:hypothetical protein
MIIWLCCFWAYDEEEHHGRELWWNKGANLMEDRKVQTVSKSPEKIYPLRAHPQ